MSKTTDTVAEVVNPTLTTDTFWVDPRTLKRGYNSRVKPEPGEKEKDILRAIDILDAGQQQPIICRRIDESTLEVTGGFGRLRSVLLARDGFEHGGKRYHNADLLILCRVDESIKSDKDAFIASIRENVRDEVSPLNKALAQEVLRKDYKLNETQIAKLYQYNNPNAIKRGRDLLKAPEEVQELVHSGELSLDACLKLLTLPKARQTKLLERLKAGEKLTGAIIGEEINAWAEEKEKKNSSSKGGSGVADSDGDEGVDDEAALEEKPTRVPRNATKLKAWIDEYVERELDDVEIEESAPLAYGFCKAIVDYLNGKGGDQKLWNAFEKLYSNEADAQ